MAEFHIVTRRGKKRFHKGKCDQTLAERIKALKTDLKLTEFYKNSIKLIRNTLKEGLDISQCWEAKNKFDSSLSGEKKKCVKNLTSHVTAECEESRLERDLKELQISENVGVNKAVIKKEPNSHGGIFVSSEESEFKRQTEWKCSSTATIEDVVCYGLGNFSDCYISRNQLAFILLIIEEIDIPICRCHIFDPKFTEEEKLTLKDLGFNVISINEAGKRNCNKRTLFYMPHCGKALYNNLIWANWGECLDNLVIIGNSFTRMVENIPERILAKTGSYIMKVQPFVTEKELTVTEKFESVFNDTVIHTFKGLNSKVSEDFWDDNSEPDYKCDPEIILS